MTNEKLKFTKVDKNNNSIEFVVAKILCNNGLTVSTAESCTGGLVASKLISYPGISEVFKEGAVTYSNEAKIKRLGVSELTLENFGAVSYETAMEMVQGIAREADTDVSIATTGIAGPGGGSVEKPVGLVYIGIKVKDKTIVKKFEFNGSREEVRNKATFSALEMLEKELEMFK
ncbi:nicotinamide-nucleotide amidohydrolase family protein [Clostridium gasigenes]|uniref:Nicotinamide-nucleotide amidase n=1 Tax=Clostridium gasigenes TaxID=94869 RepID=A0A1H0W1B8_9CLOT|nr:nicotinamide-nucleotide amidohydrolase family protein [Clostridium gasigenes]MBU3106171.1 nicotinamide-nucleotide amidohydrolase family protein [Clostridium gasigenes]MBU3134557.1 nicotinamide-nucleotide amidohydrolase family protein [Clostridium gasigenes]NKF08800.1 nicotinamide-nucleotide amidohydrolase family protein [Clostridium gasigenes]QSW20872.1 nicotinamide-nucleotide amidohydrolase family protein [Clostridium gasigenes]